MWYMVCVCVYVYVCVYIYIYSAERHVCIQGPICNLLRRWSLIYIWHIWHAYVCICTCVYTYSQCSRIWGYPKVFKSPIRITQALIPNMTYIIYVCVYVCVCMYISQCSKILGYSRLYLWWIKVLMPYIHTWHLWHTCVCTCTCANTTSKCSKIRGMGWVRLVGSLKW